MYGLVAEQRCRRNGSEPLWSKEVMSFNDILWYCFYSLNDEKNDFVSGASLSERESILKLSEYFRLSEKIRFFTVIGLLYCICIVERILFCKSLDGSLTPKSLKLLFNLKRYTKFMPENDYLTLSV